MTTRTPVRAAPPPPPLRKGSVQAFEAIGSYRSKRPTELSFDEGDILYIVDQTDPHWWLARQDTKEGLVPSNHLSNDNIRMPIVDAARRGNLDLLNESLKNGVSVNSLDKTGSSALHAACLSGHIECVERLLREPKIELNLQNKLGDTPLHNAAVKGHHEICELLLSCGAEKNIQNADSQTPRNLSRNSMVKGVFDALPVERTSYCADDYPEDEEDSDDD